MFTEASVPNIQPLGLLGDITHNAMDVRLTLS